MGFLSLFYTKFFQFKNTMFQTSIIGEFGDDQVVQSLKKKIDKRLIGVS